ncbi:hypothetical protein EPUL_005394 [Erysiphe pulchra]|uniref:Uncharacterized protein n=1 Tax=Erysiphe pulchra TaxID=225359 RepID=A0A2S4PS08_9PEZI|nr:hypothetical protein EPUL_005394 [Erysiphe pulchra]
MSPIPVAPTRSSRSDPFSSLSPSCRPRKKKNIEFSQQIPCDIPSTAICSGPENRPLCTQKGPTASLTQTTDNAFQAASEALQAKHMAPEIISVLDSIVEKAEKWHNCWLDHVPMKINCIDKTTVEVTPEIALEEIKFELGVVPKRVTRTKKSISNPGPVGSMIVSFASPVRAFRLFSTSTIARMIKRTPRITQCNRCWGFHDQRTCNRDNKCPRCASKNHKLCQGTPKCFNCRGPHATSDLNCPAKSIIRRGIIIHPSRTEIAKFRAAGETAWNIANPQILAQTRTYNLPSSC